MQTNEKKPELFPVGGEVTFLMPTTNALGLLKDAKDDGDLTASYMKWEDWQAIKGVELRCFFLGLKKCIDSDGEEYYMAQFVDENNKPFVAAQTILVDAMKSTEYGQGVKIVCTDVVGNSKKGKTVLFDIKRLSVNLKDLIANVGN